MKRHFPLHAFAVAALMSASQVHAAPFQVEVPANIEPPTSGLTRAEVIAEYHLWRLAGLQDLTRGEAGADTNSYQYRKAYATYVYLRNSSQYTALVDALQHNPNASVVAGRPGEQSAQTR